MRKTRLLAGVFFVALTSSLAALHPPTPRLISIPELAPAAYRQEEPGLAWDGTNFVAVWTDQRMTPYWRYGFLPAIYASRVSSEGTVLDPLGIELVAHGNNLHIASSERGSLLTYHDGNSSSFALPLGGDARPSGEPVNLGALEEAGIATDGLTYCVIASRWPSTNKALILNGAGKVLQTFDVEGTPSSVAAIAGRYLVISVRGTDILATTVVANRPTTSRVIASTRSSDTRTVALAGDSRVLVAWVTEGVDTHSYEYVVLDANANPAGQTQDGPRPVASSPNFNQSPKLPSLGWDGELFLLSWGDVQQLAVRIRADGTIVRGAAVVLESQLVTLASAFGGNTTLLLTIEPAGYSTDLYVRRVFSFRDLPALPERRIVAQSARPQMQPAVAWGAGAALTVSLEGDGPDSITATLFSPRGTAPALTRVLAYEQPGVEKEGASVAALGDKFLVAWREMANFSTRILAQRIGANGTLFGPPIVLAEEPLFVYFGETSVATDGESFLVAWDSPTKEILARRVAADGTLLDSAPLVVSRNPDRASHDLGYPEALWTGSTYLVAWSEHEYYSAAPPAGLTRIRGARITTDGVLVDSSDSTTYFARQGHPSGLSLASNEEGLMLVAAFSSSIVPSLRSVEAMPLDRLGFATALGPRRLDIHSGDLRLESPTVAGAGKSFVAFWTEQSRLGADARVRGARLQATAGVERFDVVDTNAFNPAATSAGNDVVLVQSQHDSVGSNVVRLFSTTFSPDEATPGKRRSARP